MSYNPFDRWMDSYYDNWRARDYADGDNDRWNSNHEYQWTYHADNSSGNYFDNQVKDKKDFSSLPLSTVIMPSGKKFSISEPVNSLCSCSRSVISATKLTKLSPGGSDRSGQEFDIVQKEMHKTLGKHNISQYKIISIDKIQNCCLWRNFRHRGQIIKKNAICVNERMLFHGSKAAEDIAKTGFNISKAKPAGMFGAGIYFAEHSSKSNQYSSGYLEHRKMILCRVALGTIHKLTQAQKLTKPPCGYHSVQGVPTESGLLYPEYVIYEADQAYPEYLITYDIIAK